MAAYTVEQLKAVGGSLWERGDKRRVYFNDVAGLYGLETSHYGTGNISSATLHGERLSNSQAYKLSLELSRGKIWYDLADNRFYGQGIDVGAINQIASEIVRRIKALVPA